MITKTGFNPGPTFKAHDANSMEEIIEEKVDNAKEKGRYGSTYCNDFATKELHEAAMAGVYIGAENQVMIEKLANQISDLTKAVAEIGQKLDKMG